MATFMFSYTSSQPDEQQAEVDREALIATCLKRMTSYAWQYRCRLRHGEVEDLIGEAMVAIMEHMEEAQTKERPIGWLLSIGKYRIIEYISTQNTLIPHHHGHQHYTILSLNIFSLNDEGTEGTLLDILAAPSFAPQEERDYGFLYEAIGHLSPKRQQLIFQRFGLNGYSESRLKDMAPTRREQQQISKQLAEAKHKLALYLSARPERCA